MNFFRFGLSSRPWPCLGLFTLYRCSVSDKMSERSIFDVWWEKLAKCLNITNEIGFWLWTWAKKVGRGGLSYGIMRVKWLNHQKSITASVHRIAYIKTFFFNFLRKKKITFVVFACCHPNHLTMETRAQNAQIFPCHKARRCFGHGPLPNCVFQPLLQVLSQHV